MKQCSICKKYSPDNSKFCSTCGNNISTSAIYIEEDQANFAYAILGFFVPIAGFVLYFIWTKDTPKRAMSCLKGALASIILSGVIIVLYLIIIVAFFLSYAQYQ